MQGMRCSKADFNVRKNEISRKKIGNGVPDIAAVEGIRDFGIPVNAKGHSYFTEAIELTANIRNCRTPIDKII